MNLKNLLSDSHLKITHGRLLVLEILQKAQQPMDIESIIELVRSSSKRLDRSTVFRIINIFCKKNIITKLEFSEGKFRYELSSLPHHYHIICKKCGSVKDAPGCNIDYLEKETSAKYSYLITNHRVDFFGICPKCQ